MVNLDYPYVKLSNPIQVARDNKFIVNINSLSFQNYEYTAQIQFNDTERTVMNFTVTKTDTAEGISLELELSNTQTALLSDEMIGTFDIMKNDNGKLINVFAGEIKVVNTITRLPAEG